jgi:hypothetical protein
MIDFMAWQENENGMSATAVARYLNKKGLKGNYSFAYGIGSSSLFI